MWVRFSMLTSKLIFCRTPLNWWEELGKDVTVGSTLFSRYPSLLIISLSYRSTINSSVSVIAAIWISHMPR